MNLELIRHAYLPKVTLGRLIVNDLVLATLEEPWHENPEGPGGARRADGGESCIPDGTYQVSPHNGTLFKNVYRLSNPDLGVFNFADDPPTGRWGRSSILIHSGNTTDDILGCILVGMDHSELEGKDAVVRSREALNRLRAILMNELHSITVRPTAGTSEKAA